MRNFELYCKDYENIENYWNAKKDDFKGWHCHHRKGEFIPKEELKALGMYYDRPAEELIFLTRSEHRSLHNKGNKYKKGKHHSEEAKKKQSETMKGKYTGENNPFYGEHHSDETKKKLSEARKGKYTGENSPFYGKTHSEETRKKIAETAKGNTNTKGMRWYNNGIENKLCFECPEGFVPGMLRKQNMKKLS